MAHTDYRVIERLMSFFSNSQTSAAKKLGTSRQNIHRWEIAGYIPPRWATKVELATNKNITAFEVVDTANFYQENNKNVVKE